jgi:hypothetical protein
LKRYDYPIMNRFGKKPTPSDFKGFLAQSRGLKTSPERFACFQFLLHLADMMDVHTAMAIGQCVGAELPIDATMVELFESM